MLAVAIISLIMFLVCAIPVHKTIQSGSAYAAISAIEWWDRSRILAIVLIVLGSLSFLHNYQYNLRSRKN